MKAVAVVNPNAGRRKTVALPGGVEILETQAPGHAIQLTRDAIRRGARTIMAVGGDGTINEVVNGFFEEEQLIATDTELAVIAKGTGSDFSRSLNRAVPSGERRLIDVMKVRYTAIGRGPPEPLFDQRDQFRHRRGGRGSRQSAGKKLRRANGLSCRNVSNGLVLFRKTRHDRTRQFPNNRREDLERSGRKWPVPGRGNAGVPWGDP